MSKSIEGAIECPFYLEEGKSFIKCEGILNGTICTHSFNNDKEKHRHHNLAELLDSVLDSNHHHESSHQKKGAMSHKRHPRVGYKVCEHCADTSL